MTRLALLVLLSTLATGCVYVGVGVYPEASGPGIEPTENCKTEVTTPDLQVEVELKNYAPAMVFFGPVLPVIPVPGFAFASGKLEVLVSLEEGTGSIRPDSLRLWIDSREFTPSTIHSSSLVWQPGQTLSARHRDVMIYYFKNLRSPRRDFTITVDGLPPIDYSAGVGWHFGSEFPCAPRPASQHHH